MDQGNRIDLNKCSCSMLSLVSTGIGDHLSVWVIFNHPDVNHPG